ncbi:sensor histidine kinase [Evansella tamaricis]|uniref:Sensor histidine kinase n=1 Tax=Evansella tamaricis TaxID=2069301 RepID=A0ABS6JI79_9BACI|nr:sensor histidine kinase [Evansella tamaricis]MBU9712043.1 sensor histidine kinase [Evansella tamaricis]
MISIQRKILMLTTIVLVFMAAIWIAMTHYNHQTLNQYNDILQRYLSMNEVSNASQDVITDLNNYMLKPTPSSLEQLDISIDKIQNAKKEIFDLRNEENDFVLTNYINLIDSFIETTDRFILFYTQNDTDSSVKEFSEATRISNYISEMTLTLVDKELKAYDRFYRGIIEQSEALQKLGIWVLMLITFLLILITYWFSLSITRPVQQLTKAANEFSKGRFETPVIVETNDEIAFLARTFDRMRININNLISEIKSTAQLENELQQNKILLQESQFRSLQSQINPHFLFNTLNTISKKAYLEGSEETGDLLVSVAGLLRYNLKRMDRSVTLLDEVIVLRQYMDIQKARFTDRLHLFIDIDESCLNVEMPSLTLQPIIENAVIHAVEPEEDGGKIWFRIRDGATFVTIEIQDDGNGMSEQKIHEILEGKQVPTEGHSTGIGFSNVVKRLRLFYSNEDVIHIESIIGRGTKVVLKIPKKRSVKVC